jgi:hypothetical protein
MLVHSVADPDLTFPLKADLDPASKIKCGSVRIRVRIRNTARLLLVQYTVLSVLLK